MVMCDCLGTVPCCHALRKRNHGKLLSHSKVIDMGGGVAKRTVTSVGVVGSGPLKIIDMLASRVDFTAISP